MRTAVVIVGPESSGTRMVTECFVRSGWYGDHGHEQRLDDWEFEGQPDRIVYRQSVPHAGQWLRFKNFAPLLVKAGYKVETVVIQRESYYCAHSQYKSGHVESLKRAYQNIWKAKKEINKQIKKPDFRLYYEPFVSDGAYRELFFARWSLDPGIDFYNANEQYRS